MSDPVFAAIAGLLFLASSFSAIASYTLRDFSRSRLDEICRGRNNGQRFGLILKRHEQTLLSVEFVYLVCTTVTAVFVAGRFGLWSPATTGTAAWFPFTAKWLLLLLTFLFTLVIFPRSLAQVVGEPLLYHTWPLLNGLQTAMRPAQMIVGGINTVLHRLCGRQEPSENDVATLTEEIRTVVDEGERDGLLESGARTMIHRIMELGDEDAAAVMTPRTDMFSISIDASFQDARSLLVQAGHTRVPVVGESTDDIVGILYAKDLLDYSHEDAPPLSEIVREPFYVPETTRIDDLLETMKRKHVHLAIVLDEYGGVAGLVTLEDVLEEIVGEIVDEYDPAEPEPIRRLGPGLAEVDARVHIDDLNEQLGCDLPEDQDYDTAGGFVFSFLGRIPATGETLTCHALRITVLEAGKRKILKLRIETDPALGGDEKP